MGQYYHPIIGSVVEGKFVPEAWAYSHEFGNGLKLMEHSWIGNEFVGRIERELMGTPRRLAWVGDYADDEQDGTSIYDVDDKPEVVRLKPDGILIRPEVRYVVNHDTRQYVDIKHCLVQQMDGSSWVIHPLPLLTAEGNGRGGGDYHGAAMDLVGSWARALISVERDDWIAPAGFSELLAHFREGR